MIRALLVATLMHSSAILAQESNHPVTLDSVLVDANGIEVTVYDTLRYLEFNLAPPARISGVNRERAIWQIAENIYVLKRAANMTQAQELLPPRHVEWVADYEATRFAAIEYFEAKRDEADSSIDWGLPAKELYLARLDEMSTGERLDLHHILIDIKERPYADWSVRLGEAVARLAGGEEFASVASDLSDDEASARKGGALGIVQRGQTVPNFEEAVFAMSEGGEISEPFLSRHGLHIVRLNAKLPGEVIPFERVEDQLIEEAKQRARADVKESAVLPFKQEIAAQIPRIDEEQVRSVILSAVNTDR